MKDEKDIGRDPAGESRGDAQFAERAKAAFDSSVERLDAATLSQLNQRRQAALVRLAEQPAASPWLRLLPATGLAAAAAVAVLIMGQPGRIEIPDAGDTAATDFEILLGEDDLEMIEELEFYSWIDEAGADSVG